MAELPPSTAPARAVRLWLGPLLNLLASASAYAGLAVRDQFNGILADGYVYLMQADSIAGLPHGMSALGRFVFGYYPFPPLYPLLLALTGAGANAVHQTFIVNAAVLALVVGLVTRWYAVLGLPPLVAWALGALFASLPVALITALDVQSEPLYLVCSMTAVLCAAAPTPPRLHWAALASGLALITRTAGVALVVAVIAYCWHSAGARRLRLVALALAPAAAWWLLRAGADLEASYTDIALRTVAVTPAALAQLLTTNSAALIEFGVRSFALDGQAYARSGVLVAALLAGVGWLCRLRQRDCAAWYVLGYGALILLWPYPHHARRFLFVVLPLLLGFAGWALQGALRAYAPERMVTVVLIAAVLSGGLLAWPSTAGMVVDISLASTAEQRLVAQSPARYFERSLARATTTWRNSAPVFELLPSLANEVPEGSCICSIIPEQVSFVSGRAGLNLSDTRAEPAALERQLQRCPYVFMVAMTTVPPNGLPPMYPYRQLEHELEVLRVARANAQDDSSAVMAMLARVPPRQGSR